MIRRIKAYFWCKRMGINHLGKQAEILILSNSDNDKE